MTGAAKSKYVLTVAYGVGQYGIGGTQKKHERADEDSAEDHYQKSEAYAENHGTCADRRSFFVFLFAQKTGYPTACAHADGKTHRLNDRHQGKNHADGGGGAGVVKAGNKVGVCHVVYRRDDHADGGGDR